MKSPHILPLFDRVKSINCHLRPFHVAPICTKDNRSRPFDIPRFYLIVHPLDPRLSFYSSINRKHPTPEFWSSMAVNFPTIVLVDEIYDEMNHERSWKQWSKADPANYYPPIIPRVLSCTGNNVITIYCEF